MCVSRMEWEMPNTFYDKIVHYVKEQSSEKDESEHTLLALVRKYSLDLNCSMTRYDYGPIC